MKRYSVFHAIVMSFFSKSLYRDVGQNWRGICFFYMLMLLAICWIPFFYQAYVDANEAVSKYVTPFVDELPQLTIKDGELSIDQPSPYIINDPDSNTPVIIFDTSGQYISLDNTQAQILITKTHIYVRGSHPNEIREYDLSKMQNFSLGREEVHQIVRVVANWWVVILYPIALILSFVFRLVQMLIYAVIGLILTSSMGRQVSFAGLMRLSAIAVTPAIILSTVLDFLKVALPWSWVCYFIIAMVYLFIAVKSNPHRDAIKLDMPKSMG